MTHPIYLIAAVDKKNGIGKKGKMPWDFKNELKYFQEITTKIKNPEKENMLIMGRATWESIPKEHRPLKDRLNVVLTSNRMYEEEGKADGAMVMHSFDHAIEAAGNAIESIFIIGGGTVYSEAIKREDIKGIYLTRIKKDYKCDTFFPDIPDEFKNEEALDFDKEKKVELEYLLLTKN